MPFVIYATPFFTDNALRCVEAISNLPDVRLAVISQAPQEHLVPQMRDRLVAHWRVNNTMDGGEIAHAAYVLGQHFGPIHRLFSHQEQLQVPLAEAREYLGIPGMSTEAARNFRDKSRMKNLLRQAGLPTARHRLASSEADAWQFVEEVGFPLVVKPPEGAASQSTFRADSPDTLRQALSVTPPAPGQPVLIEEFISGDEHSCDTFTLNGEPLFHSITHYLPSPLEVLRNPWIQWAVVIPCEVDSPQYDDIRAAAFRALKVLGMQTGMSHLEWFRRRDGTIAISEVAARPPGAQFTTLISLANDFDCLDAWARLVVFDTFDPPERRYAAGAAYLRGQGHGRIKAIHGLEQAQREVGHLVVEAKLPQVGQPTSTSYEGDGYVILRHPETEVVRQALLQVVRVVQIELE